MFLDWSRSPARCRRPSAKVAVRNLPDTKLNSGWETLREVCKDPARSAQNVENRRCRAAARL